jgi:actin-related protein 5
MFGADDADWAIYRKIVSSALDAVGPFFNPTQNTQAPSSDEEDDMQNLQEIESKLLAHDPKFTMDHTYASITTQKSALLTTFKPEYDENDPAGLYRSSYLIDRR